MNRIIENKMLVPNLHQVTLYAPEIAQAALPGQFVILRAEEDGERIPLSIADWDLQKGTLTLVFMNIGRTTQKLASLPAGADFANPGRSAGQCHGDRSLWARGLCRRLLWNRLHLSNCESVERKGQPGYGCDRGAQLLSDVLAGPVEKSGP
jgi:hypothetical protein